MNEFTSFVESAIDAQNPSSPTNESHTKKSVLSPRADGSRIPFDVYSSPEIYDLEQERIFRGPTWSFVALEVELPNPSDFKSTYVGDTPVLVTRNEDGTVSAWVNRCAHRGAILYFERVVSTESGWRYQSKRAVYDTSRVPTLLVTPV